MRKSLVSAAIGLLCSFAVLAITPGYLEPDVAIKHSFTTGTVHRDSPTLGLCIVHTDEIARAGAIDLHIHYVDVDGVPGLTKSDIVKLESRHLCTFK